MFYYREEPKTGDQEKLHKLERMDSKIERDSKLDQIVIILYH